MALICYIEREFSTASRAIIAAANAILESYAQQGYDLTLRQLYYQFIARDLFPDSWADKTGTKNTDRSYKNLGDIISNGRLAGLIDWDHITDRTRNLAGNAHWDSPEGIIEACARQFQIDKWATQKNYVEVWVEKDALIGVLDVACRPLDVNFFSCRGYTSQSEMWGAAMRLVQHARAGKHLNIIHLGDHDPSGIDMSRDITDRLEMFIRHHVAGGIEVDRIALNMPQVRQYTPPPNPAKVTDSRAENYIRNFGNESWELDALEPAVLTALIQDAVKALRSEKLWKAAVKIEDRHKASLKRCAERWPAVDEFLDEN